MTRPEIPTLDVRELEGRCAEVLERVRTGATVLVLDGGEAVAVIEPPGLRSDLRVQRARVRGGFASLPRVSIDGRAQDPLDELRDR